MKQNVNIYHCKNSHRKFIKIYQIKSSRKTISKLMLKIYKICIDRFKNKFSSCYRNPRNKDTIKTKKTQSIYTNQIAKKKST